ncbi:hypothetical protein D3C87_182430 [compost metagenome]
MKRLITFLLVAVSVSGFSQSRLLDIQSNELSGVVGFDMLQTTDGYLIAGTGGTNNFNNFFCWITKTDGEFNPVWNKKIRLSGYSYQVNSSNVTLAILENDQIVLLAKSRNDDSTFAQVSSFDQNGNFLWSRKWVQPHSYAGAVDMNQVVPLPNNEFIISHSVKFGSTQMKLDAAGTVLSSKYTHLVNPNDTTVLGVSNLHCNDGGTLQLVRTYGSRTLVTRLDAQHQISWSKEIRYDDREVKMTCAYENVDGSFWLFGSMNRIQGPPNTVELVFAVMKLSEAGNLTETSLYNDDIHLGFAAIFSNGNNTFDYNSTEGEIGRLDLNTGTVMAQRLDIFQANHGFQNMHKLQDQYALTGLGANWSESKIHLFPGIEDHPCLHLWEPIQTIQANTVPMQQMIVTDLSPQVDNYSHGNLVAPLVEFADIRFVEECLLSVSENESSPEIVLYPNPAGLGSTVTLKIDGLKQQEKIRLSVFDIGGKQVLSSELSGQADSHLVDVSHLQSGMYLVTCTSSVDSKIFTTKLVIR